MSKSFDMIESEVLFEPCGEWVILYHITEGRISYISINDGTAGAFGRLLMVSFNSEGLVDYCAHKANISVVPTPCCKLEDLVKIIDTPYAHAMLKWYRDRFIKQNQTMVQDE